MAEKQNKYRRALVTTIGLIVLSIGIMFSYPLQHQVLAVEPNNTDALNGKSNATSEFKEFISFNKDYSLQYPSDWTVKRDQPPYNETAVSIESPDLTSGAIRVSVENLTAPIPPEQESKATEMGFPELLKGLGESIPGSTVVEGPDYIKYQIDGHKSGSAVITSEDGFKGLVVGSMFSNKLISYVYMTNSEFDQGLPTAEKVLNSFKLLP